MNESYRQFEFSSESVRNFLINPRSRRTQATFIELCIRLSEKSLKRRLLKGWRPPGEAEYSERWLRELAVDTAGSLLGVYKGKPFGKVFDFYQTHGIINFGSCDSKRLLSLLEILVTNHAEQELYELDKERNPQRANIKRKFKNKLKSLADRQRRSGDDIAPLTENEDQQAMDKFLLAVDFYLMGLIKAPAVDKLPAYFREVRPKSRHRRFRFYYRRLIETVLYGAAKHFRNLMQNLFNIRDWLFN